MAWVVLLALSSGILHVSLGWAQPDLATATAAFGAARQLALASHAVGDSTVCDLDDSPGTSSEAPAEQQPPSSESAEESDTLGLDAEEMGLSIGEPWPGSARLSWLRFQEQLHLSSVDSAPQPRPVERV